LCHKRKLAHYLPHRPCPRVGARVCRLFDLAQSQAAFETDKFLLPNIGYRRWGGPSMVKIILMISVILMLWSSSATAQEDCR
jgi:hypothetical protein